MTSRKNSWTRTLGARKSTLSGVLALQIGVTTLLIASVSTAVAETNTRTPTEAASIRQSWASADTFEGVVAEFNARKVVFQQPLSAPSTGGSVRAVGTGPSGFPATYVVDNVRGRFHVYVERRRPQHPVAPYSYVSQEVIFRTPDPGVSPVGTLTYPASGTNFPAVVLVAGTGAHTRDAGMSLHKTLLVLADHLTRQGFAVLRYDKRGVGLTGGAPHPGPTTDDYAADALAAARYLKQQPNIDASKVGIVGHSEGGIIAAMLAADAPTDIAFTVMLLGTGVPGIDNKSLQDAAARRAEGMPETLVLMNQQQERGLLEVAAGKLDRKQAIAAMAAATDALPADVKKTLEVPADGIPVEAYENLLTPWFRRFLQLDPGAYLARVKTPVLALLGEKDLQVPAIENERALSRALGTQRHPKSSVRVLPGINHNLQTARTGRPTEYLLIDETVSPTVLAAMSTWMRDVVGARN